MAIVYGIVPATAGAGFAANGTANTMTDALDIIAGSTSNVYLQAVYVTGTGGSITALANHRFRVGKYTTGSTSGTAVTPAPRDDRGTASKCTANSSPTVGTTWTPSLMFGCSVTGPGGWTAPNADSVVWLPAASAKSIDIQNLCGTASLTYDLSCEVVE